MAKMIIRRERPEDLIEVRHINLSAFETETEAKLVDGLRNRGIPLISLVAEEGGTLVGHILFSPVTLECGGENISIAGLAPMAVLPEWQRKGVGSRLVEEGLRQCRNAGYDAVVVLGHPEYYPRFGFVPSTDYGIKSEYEVPAEVFMIRELKDEVLANCRGTVKYDEAFNQL